MSRETIILLYDSMNLLLILVLESAANLDFERFLDELQTVCENL